MIRVHLPAELRAYAEGRAELELDTGPVTVGEALDALWRVLPPARSRVCDERGAVRPHVNVFVGQENIRYTGGLATALAPGDVLSIVPAVSGG